MKLLRWKAAKAMKRTYLRKKGSWEAETAVGTLYAAYNTAYRDWEVRWRPAGSKRMGVPTDLDAAVRGCAFPTADEAMAGAEEWFSKQYPEVYLALALRKNPDPTKTTLKPRAEEAHDYAESFAKEQGFSIKAYLGRYRNKWFGHAYDIQWPHGKPAILFVHASPIQRTSGRHVYRDGPVEGYLLRAYTTSAWDLEHRYQPWEQDPLEILGSADLRKKQRKRRPGKKRRAWENPHTKKPRTWVPQSWADEVAQKWLLQKAPAHETTEYIGLYSPGISDPTGQPILVRAYRLGTGGVLSIFFSPTRGGHVDKNDVKGTHWPQADGFFNNYTPADPLLVLAVDTLENPQRKPQETPTLRWKKGIPKGLQDTGERHIDKQLENYAHRWRGGREGDYQAEPRTGVIHARPMPDWVALITPTDLPLYPPHGSPEQEAYHKRARLYYRVRSGPWGPGDVTKADFKQAGAWVDGKGRIRTPSIRGVPKKSYWRLNIWRRLPRNRYAHDSEWVHSYFYDQGMPIQVIGATGDPEIDDLREQGVFFTRKEAQDAADRIFRHYNPLAALGTALHKNPKKNPKIKRGAAVKVIDPHGCVLMLRRGPTDTWKPGHWNYPGGCLEPGETFKQGALRELLEEAGIRARARDVQLVHQEPMFHLYELRVGRRPKVVSNDGEHDRFMWLAPGKTPPGPLIPKLQLPWLKRTARANGRMKRHYYAEGEKKAKQVLRDWPIGTYAKGIRGGRIWQTVAEPEPIGQDLFHWKVEARPVSPPEEGTLILNLDYLTKLDDLEILALALD